MSNEDQSRKDRVRGELERGEGGGELSEGTVEGVGCGGLQLEEEGEAAAAWDLSNGGWEGEISVFAAAALVPLPHLPKEPEQRWQICLHVFIIIKNGTEPPRWKHNKYC